MSHWDDIKRLQEAAELQRQIQREGGPAQYFRNRELMRQRAESALLNGDLRRERLAAIEFARNQGQFISRAEEWARHGSLAEQFFNRLDHIKEAATIAHSRNEYLSLVEAGLLNTRGLLHEQTALHRRWLIEEAQWGRIIRQESLMDRFTSMATRAAAVYEASSGVIAGRLRDLDILNRRPLLSEQLLSPVLDYSNFSTRTLDLLAASRNENYTRALESSLFLANKQIANVTVALGRAISIPEDEEDEDILYTPAASAFDLQQEELLQVETIPTGENYSVIVQLAPTASIVEQATHCILLVTHANANSEMRTGHPIFKPTTKNMEACALLPRIVARDRDSFGLFVDCLYFLIYEGPGYANRYLENGLISEDECDTIWTIKHLRSKWLRHDIDHGKEKDIQKSRGNLKWALERLGFSALPYTQDEYTHLQRALLDDVQDFLMVVAQKLERSNTAKAELGETNTQS